MASSLTSFIISGLISGSGLAQRIENPGSTDTPSFSASATVFNSETSTLETYDATVVGDVLSHDETDYSSGHLPAGPDLSAGRSGDQYFTFKFVRTSTSKFDVKFTGTLAGCWVAVPGSTIDSASSLNGWVDMATSYAGAGVPGANTGSGGNGSNGCAFTSGDRIIDGTTYSNDTFTLTLGDQNGTNATGNNILVRIKLEDGDSLTALSVA